ncbi:hypothetical protein CBP30_07975 [Fischerella thermalis WC157]|nr:hypothetical protein CBP30_07975 [Fischerella thermalis WC157]PLZ33885.1 hypothetical protein CBP10_07020 [Fischerella thermalis WC558]
MILFSLLIEKLNCWRSWHLPYGKPLERVYGGSLFIPILSPFYATPKILNFGILNFKFCILQISPIIA